jgi:hypothetical protein
MRTLSRQENASNKKRLRGTSAAAGRFPCMAIKRALLLSCADGGAGVAGRRPRRVRSRRRPRPRRHRLRAPPIARRCSPRRTPARRFRKGTTTGQRAEPLGDKLARSDGVLCPPAGVDPEMHAPAPDGGKTPGDSAARQPRRRPDDPAEIAPFAGTWPNRRVCLTGPRPTPYMPRVRECGI